MAKALKLDKNEEYGGRLSFLEALDAISEEFGAALRFSDFMKLYDGYKKGEVFRQCFQLKEAFMREGYPPQSSIDGIGKDCTLEVGRRHVPVDYMVVFWDFQKDNPLDLTVYFSGTYGPNKSGRSILEKYIRLMKRRLEERPLKTLQLHKLNQ
jgi:hypothetical protein